MPGTDEYMYDVISSTLSEYIDERLPEDRSVYETDDKSYSDLLREAVFKVLELEIQHEQKKNNTISKDIQDVFTSLGKLIR